MELISSLDYSGLITDESGKRLSFAGIVSAFEKLFNVAIPKPYDLRADLARRKKNYSVLLPKLKETFEKNIAACGNGKWTGVFLPPVTNSHLLSFVVTFRF